MIAKHGFTNSLLLKIPTPWILILYCLLIINLISQIWGLILEILFKYNTVYYPQFYPQLFDKTSLTQCFIPEFFYIITNPIAYDELLEFSNNPYYDFACPTMSLTALFFIGRHLFYRIKYNL